MARINECGHPDRAHKARGMCDSCYGTWKDRKRRGVLSVTETGDTTITCNPNAIEHPHPSPSQVDKPTAKIATFRLKNPRVAFHVAKAVLMAHIDYEKAIEFLAPDATNKSALIEEIEKSPEVQASLEKLLKAKGLDDESKDVFVEQLWDDFLHGNDVIKVAAGRLLAKALIPEKSESKTETLNVEGPGFREGLAAMLETADETAAGGHSDEPEPLQ